jgi:hypothetical protein
VPSWNISRCYHYGTHGGLFRGEHVKVVDVGLALGIGETGCSRAPASSIFFLFFLSFSFWREREFGNLSLLAQVLCGLTGVPRESSNTAAKYDESVKSIPEVPRIQENMSSLETWLVVATMILLTALITLLQCYNQRRDAENVRSLML